VAGIGSLAGRFDRPQVDNLAVVDPPVLDGYLSVIEDCSADLVVRPLASVFEGITRGSPRRVVEGNDPEVHTLPDVI
jgi:hypothetical protein